MKPTRIAVDVGIVVTNMERSLHFYRDRMGLAVIGELTTSLIGKGRMVQLQHGHSLIKLVEMEQGPPEQHSSHIAARAGYRYMTLLVPNVDKLMAKLGEDELTVFIPVTELSHGTKIAMVEDPDGNIVEFVQETDR
ncbi:MAG: VOC family protein [Chloroflexota bacterium]